MKKFLGDNNTEFRGAEAVITVEKGKVRKTRVRKGYRIKEIDEAIRLKRTKSESRIMSRVQRSGVNVPKIISTSEYEIIMEHIDGEVLRDILDLSKNYKTICKKIGESISKMHDGDIVHGDLTTSNMILKNNEVYFIDFGLASSSKRIEDKAVDIHLIKEALEARHTKRWKILFNEILDNYNPKNREDIMRRVEKIENRGRYSKGLK